MLRARTLAIRKASVLVRAFAADTGLTAGSGREQHHALDKKRQHCHRGWSGAPSTLGSSLPRCLHSDAEVTQGHSTEDLQEHVSKV